MNKIYSSGWTRLYAVLLLPLALLLIFSDASAQTKRYVITGKVTEASTGEGLPGVAVNFQIQARLRLQMPMAILL